jgi:hypothetical protein
MPVATGAHRRRKIFDVEECEDAVQRIGMAALRNGGMRHASL